MVLDRREQSASASAAPRLGQDGHADREDPRHALFGRYVADLTAVVIFETHTPAGSPRSMMSRKRLGALLEIDRRLGGDEVLLGDGREHARHPVRVIDGCPADDHAVLQAAIDSN